MFIPPMLLEKREQPFDDPRYLYEPKIDGHRLILHLSNGLLRLFTRHNTEVTNQYPELHDVPVSCREIVLDGEVAYVNPETGAVEFETVMSRFKSANPFEAAAKLPVHFFVFDVLWIDGEDVRSRTLIERKEILDKVLTNNAFISRVIGLEGEGIKLLM